MPLGSDTIIFFSFIRLLSLLLSNVSNMSSGSRKHHKLDKVVQVSTPTWYRRKLTLPKHLSVHKEIECKGLKSLQKLQSRYSYCSKRPKQTWLLPNKTSPHPNKAVNGQQRGECTLIFHRTNGQLGNPNNELHDQNTTRNATRKHVGRTNRVTTESSPN